MAKSEDINFREILPKGRSFSDQTALPFQKSRYVPRINTGEAVGGAHKSDATEVKNSRLIYISIDEYGVVITRCFEKNFVAIKDDTIWAEKIISKIGLDQHGLLTYYPTSPDKHSCGLNQNFNYSALIFFYIRNSGMKFVAEKFSVAIPNPPPNPLPLNPFHVLKSPNSQFFAMWNIHKGPTAGGPWTYKFNLLVEANAYPGDDPAIIPMVIDPDIRNQGPP